MKVYFIFGNDGTVYEPGHFTKAEATKARRAAGMPDPGTTHVKELIIKSETPMSFHELRARLTAEGHDFAMNISYILKGLQQKLITEEQGFTMLQYLKDTKVSEPK